MVNIVRPSCAAFTIAGDADDGRSCAMIGTASVPKLLKRKNRKIMKSMLELE
jgi:hypothetical protein